MRNVQDWLAVGGGTAMAVCSTTAADTTADRAGKQLCMHELIFGHDRNCTLSYYEHFRRAFLSLHVLKAAVLTTKSRACLIRGCICDASLPPGNFVLRISNLSAVNCYVYVHEQIGCRHVLLHCYYCVD